jgi:hypothetical protein
MTFPPANVSAWIALVPLGLYFAALAGAHLRRRPLLVTGTLDAALMAAAVSGLAAVGPLSLLVPAAGGSPWSWPVLAILFALCVAICVLVSRPRLVIYNITVDQFRPLVAEIVSSLDPQARWAGESAALPGRGFQLHIEGNGPLRTLSVVNVGERSSAEGWGEFTRRLRRAVRGLRVRRSPWGPLFACLAAVVFAAATALALGPSWWPAVSALPIPAGPPATPSPGDTDVPPRGPVGA